MTCNPKVTEVTELTDLDHIHRTRAHTRTPIRVYGPYGGKASLPSLPSPMARTEATTTPFTSHLKGQHAMNDQDHISDMDTQSDIAADATNQLIGRLMQGGMAPAAVLAGAHAAVITAMASIFGGQATAERCTSTAAKVCDLPPITAENALALAAPAGWA